MFVQKFHVENFLQNNHHKNVFDRQFFLDFFLFCRVFGCFSATGVQKHHNYNKRFAKQSCRKVFTKESTKNPKQIFSSISFNRVFWAFLGEGNSKKSWPPNYLPTHVGPRPPIKLVCRPLAKHHPPCSEILCRGARGRHARPSHGSSASSVVLLLPPRRWTAKSKSAAPGRRALAHATARLSRIALLPSSGRRWRWSFNPQYELFAASG
jgi:hypothetical protein